MPSPAPTFVVTQPVTPHQAAAMTAAIEQFRRDTAPPVPGAAPERSPWHRAALLEGTGYEPGARSPWGDPQPLG